MKYKGYTAHVERGPEDGVLHGRVDEIDDVVTFEGETPEALEREFRISVDAYLEFCAKDGAEPNPPIRGAPAGCVVSISQSDRLLRHKGYTGEPNRPDDEPPHAPS